MSKILIIDDDEMMLIALSKYLHETGYKILTTADGPQGILIYKNEKPDVVILDLGLPSVGGQEVLKQIIEYNKNAKVIISTGYRSKQTEDDAMKNGAFAFFSKPFDIVLLIEKINSALQSPM